MTNRETIMALYAAFDSGDMDAVLALMADDIVWHEAENNKWADGNPYVGPEAIAAGVFGRVPEEYDSFTVEIGEVAAEGDTVVMQGRYRARVKGSGAEIAPQIVHWWTVKDGKIATFQQHVDTFALSKALGDPV